MFYCGHNKIIVATVAPPVDHSLAQQELDIFTIWKISFIVVLLWNCGTTGTGLIYYLKNKFYCGIYCGFTISVNCISYYKIQVWRQCDHSYFTINMNVLQCHLCFNKNLKWRIFKTCDNHETGSPDKLCRIGAMLITGIAAYNSASDILTELLYSGKNITRLAPRYIFSRI